MLFRPFLSLIVLAALAMPCAVLANPGAPLGVPPKKADPPVALATLPELTQAQKDVIASLPTDPPAPTLLGVKEEYVGRHYLVGDEWNLQLWTPYIQHLGGAYMGVGSDQGYQFVGWARSEYAFMVDYDPLVVEMHAIYRAFFLAAATPAEFLAWWSAPKAKDAADLLDKTYPGDPKLAGYKKLYKWQRSSVAYRLASIRKTLAKAKTPNFLDNQDIYGHIRQLVQQGRLRPVLANLLETKGIQGVGDACRKLGTTLRVVYLSNAEEYWPYGKQFRQNLRSLPFDAQTQIIRTFTTFTINKDYRYSVQPGLKYQAWLEQDWLRNVHHMIARRKLKGPEDIEFVVFVKDPADAAAKRVKGKK